MANRHDKAIGTSAAYPGFIAPCHPAERARPPQGDSWIHAIKVDGYRAQLHVRDGKVTVYSRAVMTGPTHSPPSRLPPRAFRCGTHSYYHKGPLPPVPDAPSLCVAGAVGECPGAARIVLPPAAHETAFGTGLFAVKTDAPPTIVRTPRRVGSKANLTTDFAIEPNRMICMLVEHEHFLGVWPHPFALLSKKFQMDFGIGRVCECECYPTVELRPLDAFQEIFARLHRRVDFQGRLELGSRSVALICG